MSRDNRVLLNSNTELASQVKALTSRVVAAEEAAKNVKTLSDRLTALEGDDNEMHELFTKLDEDRAHRLRVLEEKAVAVASKVEKVSGHVVMLQTNVEGLEAQGEKGEAGIATRLEHLEMVMRKLTETMDGFKGELRSTYESTIGETGGLRQVVAKLEKEVKTLAERPVAVAPVIPPPAMAATRAPDEDFFPKDKEDVLPVPPKRNKGRPPAKAPAKRVIEEDDASDEEDEVLLVDLKRTKGRPSTKAKSSSGKQSTAITAKKSPIAKAPVKRQPAKSARQVTALFTNTRVPSLEPQPVAVQGLNNAIVTNLPTERPTAKGRATRTSKRVAPGFIITDDAPKTLSEQIEEQEAAGRRRARPGAWEPSGAAEYVDNIIIQASTSV
jgi:hypothetical protein